METDFGLDTPELFTNLETFLVEWKHGTTIAAVLRAYTLKPS